MLAGAPAWMTNIGPPARSMPRSMRSSAVLLPRMFAAAARGEMTAEEAVAAAEAQMKPIYEQVAGRTGEDLMTSRREFLRLAAVAGAGDPGGAPAARTRSPESRSRRPLRAGGEEATLRIAQWSHFVPAYDAWFDNEYARRWGEEHDVEVVVDHVPLGGADGRADTEVAAERGHDIFGFTSRPRPSRTTSSTTGRSWKRSLPSSAR